MIRVIMGKKGSGKTKQMIDMINNAVQTEHEMCIRDSPNRRLDGRKSFMREKY